MVDRLGEKIGWTAGWLGGFIWVVIMSVIFLFREKYLAGLTGLLLFSAAIAGILYFSPWRHPTTSYWKLMTAPYGAFFASVIWVILAFGGIKATGLDWWLLFWSMPLLIPFASLCKRRWSDFDAQHQKEQADADTLLR
ncbi:MAG: hypothetical protein EHM85_19390 [Desulfobacteraceae bacterium]|nr:MAG: hypothetical protein EHM85_19390 [Desulfobacteraceae bacterium]